MTASLTEKMGFELDDIVVITHIDDMAMSHASNVASFECLDFGIAKCGSLITVSGWLMDAVSMYQQKKGYDVGVHLSLTSEYNTFRWRPLSTVDPKSGLFDSEGYLWKTTEEVVIKGKPEAAEQEMRAQIDIALNNGFDVTHIDCHMGTVITPPFIQSYLNLAKEYNIPAFVPKVSKDDLINLGFGQLEPFYRKWMKKLEEENYPMVDHFIGGPLEPTKDRLKMYKKMFKSLKPGLTHFLFHPAKESEELTALGHTPTERNQDYETFTSQEFKEFIESLDIHLIGYKEIRKFLRES